MENIDEKIMYEKPSDVPPLIKSTLDDAVQRASLAVIENDEQFPKIFVMIQCPTDFEARNYAGVICGYPVTQMFICDALGEQPQVTIRGILFHEMGHILKDVCGLEPSKKWLEDVYGVKYPDTEQLTDATAEFFLDVEILYNEDMVQQVGEGAKGTRPRPKGLL